MLAEIEILTKSNVAEIIKSPQLTMMLLKCYSKLYLNGSAPGYCERSIRNYYNQILITGKMKAELLEQVKNRTCKPSWNGLRYSTILNTHILPDFLSDEKAIEYLNRGILKEKDFEILPVNYKKPQNIIIERPEEIVVENIKVKDPVEQKEVPKNINKKRNENKR